jgi:hypothetical protein
MHINCECGSRIHDNSDGHSDKARWLPDKEWDGFICALDSLSKIENASPRERHGAVHELLDRFKFRAMYQCQDCGTVYIDNPSGSELNKFDSSSSENNVRVLSGD